MERFTRGEKALILAAVALACAAAAFTWANFTRAFPEASLVFKVNRDSSRPVAESFLRAHAPAAAAALAGRRHAAIFQVDDDAKVYLERELGLARLGELIASHQVRLWAWSHRYFKPLSKEEVRVEVSPGGEVIGFAHVIAEDAPGPSLDAGAARAVADKLLAGGFGIDASSVTLIESSHEERPHRRDWTFTFERTGWRASQATYRMAVEVHGDQPGGYREFLKVPDAWTQSYQRLRSENDTAATVAMFGIVLTILAAIVVLFRQARRGNVRWRLAMGLAAVAFVLFFLLSLNNLPVATYGFDTTSSFGAFLAQQVLAGFGVAGLQALLILVLVAAGEPVFRERFPGHLRLGALFEPAGWRSKRFALGLILGYCLAALFIGYQVVFYLVGSRFGAWNPAEVPFDNLLNTSFPWLAVLFIGFFPAVSEEFMARVFSIPFLDRLTGSRVVAVVVPALIWGFGHANYPAQPFYIRGVEVAIAGLFVGIVLYRFGLLPCLVWHYVVDAGYTSMLLVRSGNPYFVITALAGTGLLLVPLAVTLIAAWRRGGFGSEAGLDNAADPAPPAPPPAIVAVPEPIVAVPLRRAALVAGPLLVAGVAVTVLAPDPGRGVGVTEGPARVKAIAAEFLRSRGVNPEDWRMVVTARTDVLGRAARRYVLEHGGVATVARFAAEVPPWQVRVFRPEEREEWQLAVDDRRGTVTRFLHTLREEAPGAAIDDAQARALAEESLKAAGFDTAKLVFKEAKTERRPARTDHELTFKDPARSVGDAEYLVTVTVQGDRVDGQERRLKLPEAWERARERGTVLRWALLAVRVGLLAILIVHGLLVLYRALRAGAVPWRTLLPLTGAFVILLVILAALKLPLAWANYDAAIPAVLFRTTLVIALGVAVLFQSGLVLLGLAAIAVCFPSARAVGVTALRRKVAASAVAGALAVVGVGMLLDGAAAFLRSSWPRLFPDAPVSIPGAVATALPGAVAAVDGARAAVLLLCLGGLAIHLWLVVRTPLLRAALVAAMVVALVPGGADASIGELAMGFALAAVTVAALVAVLRWALGANPVAYLLAALWTAVLAEAAPLIAQPGAQFSIQGWVLLAAAVAVSLVWVWWRPPHETGAGEAQ